MLARAVRQGAGAAALQPAARSMAVVAYHPPETPPHLKLAQAKVPPPAERIQLELPALLARLNLQVKNEQLVQQALIHYTHDALFNNNRLAVYGAAIMDLTLTEYLYQQFPNLINHSMRDISHHINEAGVLASVAKSIGIDVLVASKLTDEKAKAIVTGDALRAFVAAVALDTGLDAARKLSLDLLLPVLQSLDLVEFLHFRHPKLSLQRVLQAQSLPPPVCTVRKETGRQSHLPTFLVAVYSGQTLLAEGAGFSLYGAKLEAIRNALRKHYGAVLKTLPVPQDLPREQFIPEKNLDFFDSAGKELAREATEASEASDGSAGKKKKQPAAAFRKGPRV